MRIPSLTTLILGSSLALCLISASTFAQTANDRVRIEVRVQSEQDRKDIAKSSADTLT